MEIILTQRQLAERWSVCEHTLEHWRVDGIGPVFLKLGSSVRYRLEDIEQFERGSLRSSTASSTTGETTS